MKDVKLLKESTSDELSGLTLVADLRNKLIFSEEGPIGSGYYSTGRSRRSWTVH